MSVSAEGHALEVGIALLVHDATFHQNRQHNVNFAHAPNDVQTECDARQGSVVAEVAAHRV